VRHLAAPLTLCVSHLVPLFMTRRSPGCYRPGRGRRTSAGTLPPQQFIHLNAVCPQILAQRPGIHRRETDLRICPVADPVGRARARSSSPTPTAPPRSTAHRAALPGRPAAFPTPRHPRRTRRLDPDR
jgi:hypothetical protein